MARVNVGIHPSYLSDQHLIAEAVEITMIAGGLKKNQFKIKSPVPEIFGIGKGHINFFKNKLGYLKSRLETVKYELAQRGIVHTANFNILEFPVELWGNWQPTEEATKVIRNRIVDRIQTPLKAKSNFHRYYKNIIVDKEKFCREMLKSELYYV